MTDWAESTALVVVDVQKGFDDGEYWGDRNNPECEENIGKLVDAWRQHGWPIVFVRHDSTEPNSPLRADSPGNDFKDILTGEPDVLIAKSAHSAFYGEPDLDGWLRGHGVSGVAICGIQTNVCCETTARQASDLGYEVLFVLDATHTFDIVAPNHQVFRARELARFTATNLGKEFANVLYTAELLD